MKKPFEEIFSELEFLFRNYSREFRASTQPYRLEMRWEGDPSYVFDPHDKTIRESLLEHVGTLPILAAHLHAYLDEPVDLGKALHMLAIHDIGETVVGDELLYTKQKGSENKEAEAALQLLDAQYHDVYRAFEARQTKEARFAYSMDKMAPDMLEALCDPRISVARFKQFAQLEKFAGMDPAAVAEAVFQMKLPHMEWSVFLKEFYTALMDKMKYRFKQQM